MKNSKLFYGLWLCLFVLILFAYRNHFDNEFHFDDGHTIQNNVHIRSLTNIPDFFIIGATTFSTLPANQLYRPVVSTNIAFDYWLSSKFDANGSGYNPFYYHLVMFIEYLIMLIMIYLFVVKIFHLTIKSEYNRWFALGLTAWYGIHVTNGETLNYIISMSDLLSTLLVIAAMNIFIYYPKLRKFGLFLIPFFLGLLTKQTAAVFTPILVVYFWFFELEDYLGKSSTQVVRKKKWRLLAIQSILIFVFTAVSIYFILSMQGESYTPGGSSLFLYMITQPFVIFHYFISFFVPYKLSADTDWSLLSSIWDIRFFIGTAFILSMFWIAFKTFKNKFTRPISFGILWFFMALAPTSSIIPLSEVMNDHRMMYPFVGLIISIIWSMVLLYYHFKDKIQNSYIIRNIIIACFTLIFTIHFFAVMQRVEVWQNGKTLWYDVSVKSPKNGRGLMNYGLQLAGEGKYNQAIDYYKRALILMPYYNYLYTNMAIAYNAIDSVETAEKYHKRSIELNPRAHNGYYYYAIFLREKGRLNEAEQNFKRTVEISPDFIYARYALLEIYSNANRIDDLKKFLDETENKFPYDTTVQYYRKILGDQNARIKSLYTEAFSNNDPAKMMELSLLYYRQKNFDSCAFLSSKIIEIQPENIAAYNNLIASWNNLLLFEKALEIGKTALSLDPNNQLLKNNLAVSTRRNELMIRLNSTNTASELINLSLEFYREEMFMQCVLACEKSLIIRPNDPIAYNNICSSYNALQDWENAAKAGEKAVELDPESQLAKNNLAVALKNLKR